MRIRYHNKMAFIVQNRFIIKDLALTSAKNER